MNSVREIYNNETIGAIAIYSILQHLQCISLAKVLLILPFTSHRGTLDFLKSDTTNVRSLEEFIVKKPELFSNFNERYYSFVTLSINSVLFLLEMKVAVFNKNMLVLHSQNFLEITEENFGSRAMQIRRGALKLSRILREEEKNLYLQLRVQL